MGLLRDSILGVAMFLAGVGGGSALDTAGPTPAVYYTSTEWDAPYREVIPEVVQEAPPAQDASLEAALARSAWPPHLWPQVIAVMRCESGFDPMAVGDHGRAWGAMQVRADVHPWLAYRHDLFTLDGNLAAAWELYQAAGNWRDWSCKP